MIITPFLFNNTAVEESPDGEGEVPTILLRSWSAQSVRSSNVCRATTERFPHFLRRKNLSFQKKMKRRLLLSEIGRQTRSSSSSCRQKGVFDFSSFFFFFNREVFLDDSSFAHSLSLLLFSKLFSSKRVNGVES